MRKASEGNPRGKSPRAGRKISPGFARKTQTASGIKNRSCPEATWAHEPLSAACYLLCITDEHVARTSRASPDWESHPRRANPRTSLRIPLSPMSRIIPYIKEAPDLVGGVVRVKSYVRVSTVRQVRSDGDFGSLDKQKQAIEYFLDIKKAQNWSLTQRVSDKAEWGDDPNRPGFQSLLKSARNHEFDVLVVMTQDRLARGNLALEPFLREMESLGIEIYDASGRRISLTLPEFSQTTRAMAWLSGQEQDGIQDRAAMSTAITAAAGRWSGKRAPLGYRIVKNGRSQALVPDAVLGELAKEIFNRIAAGEYPNVILRDLKSRGHTSPSDIVNKNGELVERGKRYMMLQHLERMIANPIYMGCTKLSRRVFEKCRSRVHATPVASLDSGEYLFKGQHEALVSEKLWEKANDRLFSRIKHRRCRNADPAGRFILQGLAKCGCCNRTMTPVNKGRRHYSCINTQRMYGPDQKVCLVRSISAPLVEDAVIRMFTSIAQHEDFVGAMLALNARGKDTTKIDAQELKKLHKERSELIQIQQNLLGSIRQSKSAASVASLTANLDHVNFQKAEIDRKIQAMALGTDSDDGDMCTATRQLERRVQDLLGALTPADRVKLKEILKTLLYGVIVTRKTESESQVRFQITLALRYRELEVRRDGIPAQLKMEICQAKRGSNYTITAPFSESRELGDDVAGATPKPSDNHPLVKLSAYLAEVEKMRPCQLAKKIGHTRAHVSQILSLKRIEAPLRRRILSASPAISSRFTLNRLLAIAKLPPTLQGEEVAAIEKHGGNKAA